MEKQVQVKLPEAYQLTLSGPKRWETNNFVSFPQFCQFPTYKL